MVLGLSELPSSHDHLLSGSLLWLLAGLGSCEFLARDNSSMSCGAFCAFVYVQALGEMQILFDVSALREEETETFSQAWVMGGSFPGHQEVEPP